MTIPVVWGEGRVTSQGTCRESESAHLISVNSWQVFHPPVNRSYPLRSLLPGFIWKSNTKFVVWPDRVCPVMQVTVFLEG